MDILTGDGNRCQHQKNRKLLEETSEIMLLCHYSIQKFREIRGHHTYFCSLFGFMPANFSFRMRPSNGKK